VDFWRVQRWANGAWINLPDQGENSNDATLKTFPIPSGIASTRLRVQLQAPSGQQVGVQDISITGASMGSEAPEPTPEPEEPDASNVVNLINAADTSITYSENWHSNRDRAHDGNLRNIATTTSDGTSAGGGG
ncbi:hypothetical protein, partial [Pseudoalteromonas fuliginea]|uniref:hypothetical protein n=1 Tax=Pseudoalteromonas fuliginea TaxID=1872678 RepID=UPI00165DFCD6